MAKTLADLYGEVSGSKELLKAFAEAAKAGTVLDFVKANGVETTEEEIQNFRATEGKLSVDELANAAGGGGCEDKCDHNWVFVCKGGRYSTNYWRQFECSKCGKTRLEETPSYEKYLTW